MKNFTINLLLLSAFLFLYTEVGYANNKRTPKNMKQAIQFLDRDCPDSWKSIIKETDNEDFEKLSYGLEDDHNMIYNWLHNSESGIVKYLSAKGITSDSHQRIVILIAFKEHLLGQQLIESTIYKPWQALEKKWEEEDKVKYTTDSIRGIYIPVDLEDCFRQIDSFWNDSTRMQIRQLTEKEFTSRVHMGFGMWMRNNWQLWGGSRLSKYFNELGIRHPDDISGIILNSYHRHLTNQEIKLDEQTKYYQEFWKKTEEEALIAEKEAFEEYKVGDTLVYQYKHGYASERQEEQDDDYTCNAQGIVLEKDKDKLLLKILLLKTCDKKGIIIYDNENYTVYDPVKKTFGKPKKRIKKYLKSKKSYWSDFNDWEPVY